MLHNDVYDKALAAYQADTTQSQAKVAANFGISQSTLHKLIKLNGVEVNKVRYPGCHDHKRDEALAMVNQGMSYRAIAKIIGCHHEVISRWVDELPLKQTKHAEPIVLTVLNPIQPWEDSGEVIHFGNLGRVLAEQYGQAWEGDE